MMELVKIKQDIQWLINQVRCLSKQGCGGCGGSHSNSTSGQNITVNVGCQNNKVREVELGFIPPHGDLEKEIDILLGKTNLTVAEDEIIILVVRNVMRSHRGVKVRKYYFTKGKGSYSPLSSGVSYKDLVLDYESLEPVTQNVYQQIINNSYTTVNNTTVTNPVTTNNITSTNVIYYLGDIGTSGLYYFLNTSTAPYDLSNKTKSYFFRFEQGGKSYLYYFDPTVGGPGYALYGQGENQFESAELILFYVSTDPNATTNTITPAATVSNHKVKVITQSPYTVKPEDDGYLLLSNPKNGTMNLIVDGRQTFSKIQVIQNNVYPIQVTVANGASLRALAGRAHETKHMFSQFKVINKSLSSDRVKMNYFIYGDLEANHSGGVDEVGWEGLVGTGPLFDPFQNDPT